MRVYAVRIEYRELICHIEMQEALNAFNAVMALNAKFVAER